MGWRTKQKVFQQAKIKNPGTRPGEKPVQARRSTTNSTLAGPADIRFCRFVLLRLTVASSGLQGHN